MIGCRTETTTCVVAKPLVLNITRTRCLSNNSILIQLQTHKQNTHTISSNLCLDLKILKRESKDGSQYCSFER